MKVYPSATELLKHIEYSKDDIVFLSGSLIEGIGNTNSDLDVFIISSDMLKSKKTEFNINTAGAKVDFKTILGVGLDIEYWDLNEVEKNINILNNVNFEDLDTNLSNIINIGFINFLHRFKVGECIHNKEKFEKIYTNVDYKKYFRYKIRFLINTIENQYEDIIGNLNSKRYKTALYIARKAVVNACYAYLLNKGISLDREKWIIEHFERLARNNDDANMIFSRFEKLMFTNVMDFKRETEEALVFVNDIIDVIQDSEEGI